jgi:predicted phage replisome organizer
MDKKYYWLKLKKDFFKRHDIKIIEDMDNGKDYILFYLKLLCESVDHEGNLRFSETIPYNEKMLSTITNTNIDIVRSAMKVFTELNMIEVLEDSTIFMRECNKMLGCETAWAEKKRVYREKQRTMSLNCPPDVRQEIEKELEIDIEQEIDIVSKKESNEKNNYYLDDTRTHERMSYDEIFESFGVEPELKRELIEFIRHCLMNNVQTTNDKLQGIIVRLDKVHLNDTQAKIDSVRNAISGGYFDIIENKR